jgi:hypothetical protein
MKQNKFLSGAMALLLIAFCTISWVNKKTNTTSPTPITITGTYDFSTFPNLNGTFVTSGALNLSGTSTMNISQNINGVIAHCEVTLTPSDGSGTIVIHQECVFNTPIPQGRWEIVGGTGAYSNLKGNGSTTMPPNQEAMTGVIY